MTLVLCCLMTALASQSGSAEDNILTLTYESDNADAAGRFNLYLLANDARIVTGGKTAGNVLPGSTAGSGYDNMTEPISKGTTGSGLWFTDSAGNKIRAASKVEYEYKYRRGKLTVTVRLYDPAPELTGMAIVGITSDESANYYSDVGGTVSISEYIRGMYNTDYPDEGGTEKESQDEKPGKEAPVIDIGGGSEKHRPPCVLKRLGLIFSS